MTQQDSCEETTGSGYLRREGRCDCVWRWEMWWEGSHRGKQRLLTGMAAIKNLDIA